MEIAHLNGGLRLWVNLCDKEEGNLYYGVEFEPDEIAIVKRLVKAGDVFFDIGASIGVYTFIASRLVGYTGTVHAFEPASYAYEVLLKNIELNGITNVVANQLGVSDRSGEAELLLNLDSGLTGLGRTGRGHITGTEIVQTTTLDEYVKRNRVRRVDFLKVDVEGFEGHVFRGGRGLIEDNHNLTVLCELAEKNFKPLNLSVDEVIGWMLERGYEAWEIDRENRRLLKLAKARLSSQNYNFIFARPKTPNHSALTEMQQ